MQWDSALAVNYPARSFGIQRGDSFDNVATKSGGNCIAIHLPIVPGNSIGSSSISSGNSNSGEKTRHSKEKNEDENGIGDGSSPDQDDKEDESLEEAYKKEFHLPKQLQEEALAREKNKRRRQSEGKASLER